MLGLYPDLYLQIAILIDKCIKYYYLIIHGKRLSLCQQLKISNQYIFAT